eukprot:TRINITY_DN1476_c2_g1_i1.p1 TRINITY_DN1476_c2_g1~~TRINITY_DN1476_c2_g1_i1.p1  ORF type:complete len:594 (+),score=263.08 TRINITY_DN1476_c2_g1_i1:59-1840(+)
MITKANLDKLSKLITDAASEVNDVSKCFLAQSKFRRLISYLQRLQLTFPKQNFSKRSRQNCVKEFQFWLKSNGANLDNFIIKKFPEGYGLETTKKLEVNEKAIEIPLNLVFSTDKARQNKLVGALIDKINILKEIPALQLILFLLHESESPNSFWAPYLNILPREANSYLGLDISEIEKLVGTPTQAEIVYLYINAITEYVLLLNILMNFEEIYPLRKFNWKTFVWVYSIVVSRQNNLPIISKEGFENKHKPKQELALIPFWDLCNHKFGRLTTHFDANEQKVVCLAFMEFKENSQFYICYGFRPTSQLFLYQRFVPEINPLNTLTLSVPFPLPKHETCVKEKQALVNSLLESNNQITASWIQMEKKEDYKFFDFTLSLTFKDSTIVAILPANFMRYFRTAVLNPDQINNEIVRKLLSDEKIDETNELVALQAALDIIELAINQYPQEHRDIAKVKEKRSKLENMLKGKNNKELKLEYDYLSLILEDRRVLVLTQQILIKEYEAITQKYTNLDNIDLNSIADKLESKTITTTSKTNKSSKTKTKAKAKTNNSNQSQNQSQNQTTKQSVNQSQNQTAKQSTKKKAGTTKKTTKK